MNINWKITINSIVQDKDNADITDFDVTFTNNDTGATYRTNPPLRCANLAEFNNIIEQNLRAYQSKDAFINLSVGDYTVDQIDAPTFVAVKIALSAQSVTS